MCQMNYNLRSPIYRIILFMNNQGQACDRTQSLPLIHVLIISFCEMRCALIKLGDNVYFNKEMSGQSALHCCADRIRLLKILTVNLVELLEQSHVRKVSRFRQVVTADVQILDGAKILKPRHSAFSCCLCDRFCDGLSDPRVKSRGDNVIG